MSDPALILTARVVEGRIVWDSRATARRVLSAHVGQRVDITIRPHRRDRSLSQNAYLWGVVLPMIAEHVGDEPEPTLRALLGRWRGYTVSAATGHEVARCTSSSGLTVEEFGEFIEFCVRFAAEMFGLVIPEAGTVEVEA